MIGLVRGKLADSPPRFRRAVRALPVALGFLLAGWSGSTDQPVEPDPGGASFVALAPPSPIETSVYSLPSTFFTVDEASSFLRAVRRIAPDRRLVVLTDLPLPGDVATRVIATDGPRFSPWVRDPVLALRGERGWKFLARPNRQHGREEDNEMARLLAETLAPGGAGWSRAPVPFHNGHLLPVGETLWLSFHSLETRILERLDLDRIPAARFDDADVVDRYTDAARAAAEELGTLLDRRPRFVHPLPDSPASIRGVGEGAGYDLDSYLTILAPPGDGPPRALVGDLSLGARLVAEEDPQALARFGAVFDLAVEPSAVGTVLIAAQSSSPARGLVDYTDLVASHLRGEGLEVERIPLLLVPTSLVRGWRNDSPAESFLLTWNNVEAEGSGAQARAEGFSMLLPRLDRAAVEAFAAAGYRMDLLPPLIESILYGGGYRCASMHLRVPSAASADES